MYRFLVVAIFLAVAGLELTYPTTEMTSRVRGMLPEIQMTSVLTPQVAVASEATDERDPAALWDMRRVNHAPPPSPPHRKRFHSGL